MTEDLDHKLTHALNAAARGDQKHSAELLPLVYAELRKLAEARLARTPPGNTLQPTALVHEAYLRVADNNQGWDHRGHFFGAAARAMRDILVEQARRKGAIKHGGGRKRVDIDDAHPIAPPNPAQQDVQFSVPAEDMLALDQVLRELEQDDPRKAEVVMLRFFAGLTSEQVALALNISLSTVEREWRFARSWLQSKLRERNAGGLTPEAPT
ncbi:MAG: sigma-70 family RNA polymerase sigma factor [Phycisphaerales bacterium]|nr:sigma-70 family RNA polymerase sigma factor [Phycisphaerales bacterium]